jgi:hypothetical protein
MEKYGQKSKILNVKREKENGNYKSLKIKMAL